MNVVIPASVTTIGLRAFEGCTSLASVEMPASVTEIGPRVFAGCDSLEKIEVASDNRSFCVIDGVLYSKEQTILLYAPKKVTSFVIPASVTRIADGAFNGCTSLSSVEIPSSVTEIGDGAFNGCTSLASVEIPDSVTKIADEAFKGCTSLERVSVPRSARWEENTFANCPKLKIIRR